jgi:hypothetical protein
MPHVMDGQGDIDPHGLTSLVFLDCLLSFDIKGVIVHSSITTTLNLSADTTASKVACIDIVVQSGCIVLTPQQTQFKGNHISRSFGNVVDGFLSLLWVLSWLWLDELQIRQKTYFE